MKITRQMESPQQIRSFILAGNALFTLKSLKTNEHYTFKVVRTGRWLGEKWVAAEPPSWQVQVLAGRDNSRNYKWIGRITSGGSEAFLYKPGIPSAKGFNWFWQMLKRGSTERFAEQCQFHHAGRCGRCGRLLTRPESIESGIGPECQDKMDFEALGGAEVLLVQLFGG